MVVDCRDIVEAVRQPAAEDREIRLPQHGSGQVDQDGGRDLQVARIGATSNSAKARGSSAPLDGAQESGLADTGFPGQQHESATLRHHLGDASVGKVKKIVPPDEHRTDEMSNALHASECRSRSETHIGQMTDDRPHRSVHGVDTPGTIIGSSQGGHVATFMDVHSGFVGVTSQQLREAHERDLAIEQEEGVHFERAWLDPVSGKVFCLSTGPSREAVMRIHERSGHPTAEVYETSIVVA